MYARFDTKGVGSQGRCKQVCVGCDVVRTERHGTKADADLHMHMHMYSSHAAGYTRMRTCTCTCTLAILLDTHACIPTRRSLVPCSHCWPRQYHAAGNSSSTPTRPCCSNQVSCTDRYVLCVLACRLGTSLYAEMAVGGGSNIDYESTHGGDWATEIHTCAQMHNAQRWVQWHTLVSNL